MRIHIDGPRAAAWALGIGSPRATELLQLRLAREEDDSVIEEINALS